MKGTEKKSNPKQKYLGWLNREYCFHKYGGFGNAMGICNRLMSWDN